MNESKSFGVLTIFGKAMMTFFKGKNKRKERAGICDAEELCGMSDNRHNKREF